MADLHLATSTYDTGTNDTFTTLTDFVDQVLAIHQNGPASAVVAIETILGTGTTLKGSAADLVARLAVALQADGKLKDFSSTTKNTFPGTVSEGCTGATSFTASQLVRKHASNDVLESAGVTIGSGTSGDVLTTVGAQTITGAKTFSSLVTPTIANFTNATHTHLAASSGGLLGSNSVGTSQVKLTAQSFVSASHDAASDPLTDFFTVTGTRIGDFTITPSNTFGGTVNLIQEHDNGVSTGTQRWKLTAAQDGSGGSVNYTVSWNILATVS